MSILKRVIHWIDKCNDFVGWAVAWSVVPLVILVAIEVVRRFVFNSPTIWSFTITTWIYGASFMLGGAFTHLYKAHVRVDLFYANLAPKTQVMLDVITYLILVFPACIALFIAGTNFSVAAWKYGQHLQGIFSPHLGPIKTVMPIALGLLILQCISDFLKKIVFLSKGEKL